MNRSMKSVLGTLGMMLCADLLSACAEPATGSAKASDTTPAAAEPVDGLSFTISGPAFSEPATFEVPGDTQQLRVHLYDNMFTLKVSPNDSLRSTDGKHVVSGMVIGTQPAGVGESTQTAGVTDATFDFDTDIGTERQQGSSMSFRPSKGELQPIRIVMESYQEGERAVGSFSGKLQRTNIKSRHEIYNVTGTFNVID